MATMSAGRPTGLKKSDMKLSLFPPVKGRISLSTLDINLKHRYSGIFRTEVCNISDRLCSWPRILEFGEDSLRNKDAQKIWCEREPKTNRSKKLLPKLVGLMRHR